MKFFFQKIFFWFFFIPSLAFSKPTVFYFSERHGKNQISFESKSPLEFIEGVVNRIEGTASFDASAETLGLKGSIAVPVESMQTGLVQRDEHLYSKEWMAAEAHPNIRLDFEEPLPSQITKKGSQKWFVNLKGRFQMKGISNDIIIPLTVMIKKEGKVEKLLAKGRFSLRLADFSIHGPSSIRMIGVRVGETVAVNVSLVGLPDKGWEGLR